VTRVDSSYSDLLRAADIALQVAKRPSWEKSWHIYGDKSDQQVTEYSEERWRQNLQEAITHHHITFLSQPALDANSGETLHMEMLARLPDEQGEQIPASVFIPVADRVDMRQQLDREIIDTWFRTVERNGVLTRSVLNIGIPSLLDDEFLAWLLGRIATNPVASAMLTLEVSATALGNKRDAVLEVVRELREQHIGFAFDHFGSAHVDISYLSSFLPQHIKLEGTLSQRLLEYQEYRLYLRSLVDMAHSLDILVIAQNVETAEQKAALMELGIDGLQGGFIEKPSVWV